LIFVTVGSHYEGFERLVKKMDEIAGRIDEEVIMQIGYGKYKPKNADYFDFKNYSKFHKLIRKARVVVCHGGVGAIITALEQGKTTIVVPRLKEYGEIIDNHQLEIMDVLSKEGKVIAIYNMDELEKVLKSMDEHSIKVKKDKGLINFLADYLSSLEKSLKKRGGHQ